MKDEHLLEDQDLASAFREVRDTYDGTNPEASVTLQRALFRTRKHASRQRFTRWGLIPIAADRFKYRGSQRTLTVLPAVPEQPTHLRVDSPNTRPVEYEAVARPRTDAATLAGYAGDYRSPELDARYHFVVSGDTLRFSRSWEKPVSLRPLYQDGFLAGGQGIIRFLRDPRGRVTGFVLWAGRVRHLRFEKVSAGK